jgi:hypothetical protein
MGEEFYAVIKLVSGEEIFSMVCVEENDDEDPTLLLYSPIRMNMFQTPKGSFIRVNPWMELTSEDMFVVKLDKIITITECNDQKLIDVYKRYLEHDDDSMADIYRSSGKVKVTDQMGYVSTVEQARENLENIFNNTNKES